MMEVQPALLPLFSPASPSLSRSEPAVRYVYPDSQSRMTPQPTLPVHVAKNAV